MNVAERLSRSARDRPNQPALLAAKGDAPGLTFGELDQSVNRACSELLRSGISQNQKTLLFVKPGPDLIVWAFALFRVGAIPVIIDPGMGLSSFLSCIRRTRPESMVAIRRALWLSKLFPSAFRSVRHRLLVGPVSSVAKDFSPKGSTGAKNPQDLAAIVFTSGSTGPPKGVRYLHRTFGAQIEALREVFGMQPGEIDLVTLPVFGLFNPALGITSVIPEIDPRRPAEADPERIVRTLVDFEVTSAFASPVIGQKTLSGCRKLGAQLPRINRFLLAGAPVPPVLAEDLASLLPNGRVITPYGSTEALPVSFADSTAIAREKDSVIKGAGSLVGKPLPCVRVTIMPVKDSPLGDYPEGYTGLDSGEVGEICVSGPMVTDGYHRMPGATCDARFKIGDEPCHRMGDLGYFDAAGNLRFLGRKAERVMTESGPLETDRIEPLVNTLACVRRCALIGIGDRNPREPCLVVEPECSHLRAMGESDARKEILRALEGLEGAAGIARIFFERRIPVDARHNAKIHRLSLSRKWSARVSKRPDLGLLA